MPMGQAFKLSIQGMLRVLQNKFNSMQHLMVAKQRQTPDFITVYCGAKIHNSLQ